MKKSVRRTGIAILTVAAVAGLTAGAATAATDAAKATSTVTIQAQQGGFFGFVKSPVLACKSGRRVTLYRVVPNQPPHAAGRDFAQANGNGYMWSINITNAGKYFAKVDATSACQAAQSKTLQSQ